MAENLKKSVVNGDSDAAMKETKASISAGNPAKDTLAALVSGMSTVAKQFEDAEIYLPQVMVAADAMTAAITILEPELAKAGGTAKLGTVILGTVEGDIHDIGKALVGIMLKGANFEVVDLGRDVKVERFWEEVRKHNANIVAVSALMSTTTLNQRKVITAGKEDGSYPKVKVLIGGACATQEWAEKIGAYYGANASEAQYMAKKMVGK
jgi:dimethylamine corrinoid protein